MPVCSRWILSAPHERNAHVQMAAVQATCELVYAYGSRMARCGVQLSDVTRPVRIRVRGAFYRGAGTTRSDMGGALYERPLSTAAEALAIAAPTRWPELLDPAATPPPREAPFHVACALVPTEHVRDEDVEPAMAEVPDVLRGAYFGTEQRRREAPAAAAPVRSSHAARPRVFAVRAGVRKTGAISQSGPGECTAYLAFICAIGDGCGCLSLQRSRSRRPRRRRHPRGSRARRAGRGAPRHKQRRSTRRGPPQTRCPVHS